MLIIKRPWTRQPQGPCVPVRPSLRLVSAVGSVWSANTAPRSVAEGCVALAHTTSGTTETTFPITAVPAIDTGDFTFFTVLGLDNYSYADGVYQYALGTDGNNGLGITTRHESTAGNVGLYIGGAIVSFGFTISAAIVAGINIIIVARRSGMLYVRFNDTTASVANTTSITGATTSIVINDFASASSVLDITQDFFFAGLEPRGWSDAEMLSVRNNPWQLFAPRRIPIPTAAAGATVPTLSASTYVPGSLTSTGWRPQITAS